MLLQLTIINGKNFDAIEIEELKNCLILRRLKPKFVLFFQNKN